MRLFANAMVFAAAILISSVSYSSSAQWATSPVISSSDCKSLDYQDIVKFLSTYFYPTLGYSKNQDAAGREMMESYAIATALVLRSQTCMAEALELKEVSDALKKEQVLVSSGTSMSKKEIKKQRKLSADASRKIEQAAKAKKDLTPEQRKLFSVGATAYLVGTHATSELFKKIEAYSKATSKEVQSGGLFNRNSLEGSFNKVKGIVGTANTIRVISSGMKDHLKTLFHTSKFIMEYCKNEDIELPSEATDSITSSVEWV